MDFQSEGSSAKRTGFSTEGIMLDVNNTRSSFRLALPFLVATTMVPMFSGCAGTGAAVCGPGAVGCSRGDYSTNGCTTGECAPAASCNAPIGGYMLDSGATSCGAEGCVQTAGCVTEGCSTGAWVNTGYGMGRSDVPRALRKASLPE